MLLLMRRPDVEIVGISCVAGNVGLGEVVKNVLKVGCNVVCVGVCMYMRLRSNTQTTTTTTTTHCFQILIRRLQILRVFGGDNVRVYRGAERPLIGSGAQPVAVLNCLACTAWS